MASNKLNSFIENTVNKDGLIPSAVYAVGEKGKIVDMHACGTLDFETGEHVSTDTIYDLASLTKPFVTGLIAALMIEKGGLSLDDRVVSFFPKFDGEGKSEITIRHLAAHVSGLPAWIPFYLQDGKGAPKERVLAQIVSAKPVAKPDREVIYSDLNFILLGFILEQIAGMQLNVLAERMIFVPLGLVKTFFNPSAELRKVIAPSEVGNVYEENLCRELYPDIEPPADTFRSRVIRGEVHDGNCFFLGGVAGHAGLFSNAGETFRLACQFLAGSSELLSPDTCALFFRNLTPGLNQARSLAFQLAETKNSTAGPGLPPSSFGHLGFTGTSVWIDPENERIYTLLTNRSHKRMPPFPDLAALRKNFNSTAQIYLANRDFSKK